MVDHLKDYRWSSYPAFGGYEKAPPWLETGWLLSLFGKDKGTMIAAFFWAVFTAAILHHPPFFLKFPCSTADSFALDDFVAAARSQIGVTRIYDPSCRAIDYPNDDVPKDRGVCTDVVIRALRDACNYDLQHVVHEEKTPLVIHNIGAGTQEEDRLLEFRLTGHYRINPRLRTPGT
jgi:uncharacterized protein YijF (DUF1287 family)